MKLRVSTNNYFDSIRQFSFVKEIGVGSFGSVKLALHIQTNKCYAVKIVNIGPGISENQLLLLEREINIHSNVDHPHIIKLWDTLVDDNTVYMILELAENGTLFNYQNKHRIINQAQAFKFFSQTLSAIQYMHSHDMMHRDIKPENILLDSSNNVKICDLGWATDNISMKRKTFCGTYEYMAPEMVFEKQYNYSIDIWALGILIYELLHSFAPFPAKNIEEMRQKVKLGYYELGTNLSKQIKSLIIEILQFDPDLRPSFKQIISHAWMEKMRKEIKGQIGKIKSELQGEISNRAIVQRQKTNGINTKKHKQYDSLINEDLPQNHAEIQKIALDQKKKGKKKCKTQGQESMEKLLTETGKIIADNSKLKWKRQKQNNSKIKLASQIGKTITFKNESMLGTLKMKRIADKLSELTNKYPAEKKKGRLKTQKQQL